MSVELEHRKIDPEVCPRCGNDWTEDQGQDRDGQDIEDYLPDTVRSCPECEKNANEHHEGTYSLTYRQTLECVSWTDDEGNEHVVHDTEALTRAAAGDLLKACEATAALLEGVADEEERKGKHNAALNVRQVERLVLVAIAKARGEV